MTALILRNLRFDGLIRAVDTLAECGGLTNSLERLLREIVRSVAGILEETGRDMDPLIRALTATLEQICAAAAEHGLNQAVINRLYEEARTVQAFADFTIGAYSYAGMARRVAAAQFAFKVSELLQNPAGDPAGLPARQAKSQAFLESLFGYGKNALDQTLKTLAYNLQRRLARIFLLQVRYVRVALPHVSIKQMEEAAFAKYGVETDGLCTCVWCKMVNCLDGGRWPFQKEFRPPTPEQLEAGLGFDHMSRFMALAYGVSRNSAFGFYTGFLRWWTEFAGEFLFLLGLKLDGGLEGRKRDFGAFEEVESRHMKQWLDKVAKEMKLHPGITEEEILDAAILLEIGDVLAWISLAFHAFGLDPVQGLLDELRSIAERAGVTLELPGGTAKVREGAAV